MVDDWAWEIGLGIFGGFSFLVGGWGLVVLNEEDDNGDEDGKKAFHFVLDCMVSLIADCFSVAFEGNGIRDWIQSIFQKKVSLYFRTGAQQIKSSVLVENLVNSSTKFPD